MDDNDKIGCCAEAGYFNLVRVQANRMGWRPAIKAGSAAQFYTRFGYVPGETDPGTRLLDLLESQSREGVPGAVDGTPYSGLWSALEPSDLNSVRLASAYLGGTYAGFALAASDTFDGVMDTVGVPASRGDQTPGSGGGHCMCLLDYAGTGETDLVTLGTWGSPDEGAEVPRYSATWRWVESRMTEAYALVHPQLLGPTGLTDMGIDRDTLEADIKSFVA